MSTENKQKKAILFSGGGQINIELVKTLLDKERGNEVYKRAVYIGAANGDRVPFFLNMKSILVGVGIPKVTHLKLAQNDVDVAKAKELLQKADVIFISGGEVEDGMNWLDKHGLRETVVEQYYEGKQFICVSAGTIMMGKYWLDMDEDNNHKNPKIFTCLGIIPHVFDTHAENEDWIELKTALRLLGNNSIGYGIPTLGLITATSDGKLEGINSDLLEFMYNEKGYIITPKREIC